MSRRTYNAANRLSPLWVWAVVVCLLLLTFVVYRLFLEERVQKMTNQAFIAVNAERLQKFAGNEAGETRFRVVSLGTSLTRAATYPEYSGKYSGLGFPGGLKVLNISRPGARFDHFTTILPQVIAAHPDVLLIHADLLRLADARMSLAVAGRECRSLIERWFGELAGLAPVNKDDSLEDEWRWQNNRACSGSSPVRVTDERIAKKRAQYSQEVVLPPAFIELVGQARERGIRVVVLHVSRHYELRQHYSRLLGEWLVGLRTALLPLKDIPVWISPGNFAQEDYCDFSHLNENGREKFTTWLLPHLADLADEISRS